MNSKTKIGLALGIVGFMILMVWLFSGGVESTENKRTPFVSSNWRKRFQIDDKNPMGLYLFTQLTRAHIDNQHKVLAIHDWIQLDTLLEEARIGKDEDEEKPHEFEKKTFMFTGNYFGLQNLEIDTIISHVKRGSDLFLSFNDLTENLYGRLMNGIQFEFDYAESVNVYTDKQKYKMINLYQNDTIACEWQAFGDIKDYVTFESLSTFMEMSNFLRIPMGEGFVYLHSSPNMFYNYQLKRLHGFKYSEYVLNQLADDRDVYLLELGRLADDYGTEDLDMLEGLEEGKVDDSYLQLIFKNPTLLTALLLSILGMILFVIFRTKRTRPIVPFVGEKKDMTLAFAETITSIYFAKRNPYGLLQVQKKNFYSTMHKHFFVELQKREGDKAVEVLAEKSDTPIKELQQLLARLETTEAFSVNEQFVAETQSKVHAFYRRTGVISQKLADKVRKREYVFNRSPFYTFTQVLGAILLLLKAVQMLVLSQAAGIFVIIIALILFAFVVRNITRPHAIFNEEELIYYPFIGWKRKYDLNEISSIENRRLSVVIYFNDGKRVKIAYGVMTRSDREQFKKLISKLNTL